MHYQKRNSPHALRYAERRRREDEATRLHEKVPDLLSLDLAIDERADSGINTHIRRVVVDCAPALFLVPCGDPRCADGEHDLTPAVMRALQSHQTSFQGEDHCHGALGAGACSRVLHFRGTARYVR